MHKFGVSILIVGLLVGATSYAQRPQPPGPKAPYALKEVGSYGSDEAEGEDALEKSARVLGRVTEMRMSPDQRELFVLDNVARKLVAIAEDGRGRIVMTWREGKGPGEFTRPRGFAFVGGNIVVADQSQPRLSFYSGAGKFIRTVPFPGNALQAIDIPSGLAVLRLAATPGRYEVMLLDPTGHVVDSAVAMRGRPADFGMYGEPGRLFLDQRANPWLAIVPGMLCEIRAAGQCTGQDLLPEVRGRVHVIKGQEVRAVLAGVSGAIRLKDGRTAVLLTTWNSLDSPVPRNFLLMLDPNGKYEGYVDVPLTGARRLAPGFLENEVVIATDDPYPRIVRYSLRRLK